MLSKDKLAQIKQDLAHRSVVCPQDIKLLLQSVEAKELSPEPELGLVKKDNSELKQALAKIKKLEKELSAERSASRKVMDQLVSAAHEAEELKEKIKAYEENQQV